MSRATPRLTRLDDRITPALVGGIDQSFGTAGRVNVAFDQGGTKADAAAAVAVQADGKIVVVGTAVAGATDTDFAVARLNPDGSPDTTFGTGGQVVIGFDLGGTKADTATGVAIDAAGNIVVVGFARVDATDIDFAVARLTFDGKLDATFDGDGRQTIAFDNGGSNSDTAAGVAIDSQGRIVVVGTITTTDVRDTDIGVARLTSAGALDTTFGVGGKATVAFDVGGSKADTAAGVAIDGFDRVVVAGTAVVDDIGDRDFAVARLTATGTPDSTFNGTGRQTVGFDRGTTNADTAAGVAIDKSGNVVVVGTVAEATGEDTDFGVARLTDAGALDTTFGANGDGRVSVGFDFGGLNRDRAAGVAIDARNRVVVAGTVDQPTAGDTDVAVMRLTAAGDLDAAFDADGKEEVAFDGGDLNRDAAAGVALDRTGRVVVAATIDSDTAGDTDFGVTRLIGGVGRTGQLAVGGPATSQGRLLAASGAGFADSGTFTFPVSGVVVRPATADLNGDGVPDQVFGAGPGGGSRVRVVFNVDPAIAPRAIAPPPVDFDAFEPGFTGGVFVAAADVDGDGAAEVIVSPDVGGGGRVSIFRVTPGGGAVRTDNFFGIDDPNFRGGARVAAGDINGDGRADLVVGAGFLGGPRVAVFDGGTLGRNVIPGRLIGDFFAFPGSDATTLRNGVFVTVGDVNGDGFGDLIFGGGPGGGPRVFALDGALITGRDLNGAYGKPVANFFVAGNAAARGGVRLAVADIDGDNAADLVTASGDSQPGRVRVYLGATVPQANGVEPPVSQEFDPFGGSLATGVFVG